MGLDALLATFRDQYQNTNPRDFWERNLLKLNLAKTELAWSPPPGPRVIARSETTWKGQVWQWYGAEGTLKSIIFILNLHWTKLHIQEKISLSVLLTFTRFLDSFRENVLHVYQERSWVELEKAIKINFPRLLPRGLEQEIFKWLPQRSLCSAKLVCRQWYRLISGNIWLKKFSTVRRLSLIHPYKFSGTNDSGNDIKVIRKGKVFGSTHTQNSSIKIPTIWDHNGQFQKLVKIKYMPTFLHTFLSSIFLDDTQVVICKCLSLNFHVEYWTNYQADEPTLRWSKNLATFAPVDMNRLANVQPINPRAIICEAWETVRHNEGFCLYKMEVKDEEPRLVCISPERFNYYQFIDPYNVLCYGSRQLTYKKIDRNGTITQVFRLGALNPLHLYFWCEDYIAFWASESRDCLRVFQTFPNSPSEQRPLVIDLHSNDAGSRHCLGVEPYKPILFWSEWRIDKVYLHLHYLLKNTHLEFPVVSPNPITYFHILTHRLLLTCAAPSKVKQFDIRIWDIETMECLDHRVIPELDKTVQPQFLHVEYGFAALNLAGKLILIKEDAEKRFDIQEFPEEVKHIEARLGTLFILPKAGMPLIATT